MFGFGKKEKVEFSVTCGRPATASQAVIMHRNFVDLAMRCDVELVRTEGDRFFLRATEKKAEKFLQSYRGLSIAGLV